MGIVYVLSNPSLHGQCKVGYTLNSVKERLSQLNSSTSIPTKFVAEYYIELEDDEAYQIEQTAHTELRQLGFHHGKEYFKCTPTDCKNAIAKAVALRGSIVLFAQDEEVTREKVAREKKRISDEVRRQEAAAESERKLVEMEEKVRQKYASRLAALADPGEFIPWWVACSVITAMCIVSVVNRISDGGLFFSSVLLGLVSAFFVREWVREKKQGQAEYLATLADRDRQLMEVRKAPAVQQRSAAATVPASSSGANPKKTNEVKEQSIKAPMRSVVSSARAEQKFQSQFRNPMNIADVSLMLSSIPVEPGYCVLTGASGSRFVVAHGKNTRDALRAFIEFASKCEDPKWDEYLSLGFSPVKLAKVESSSEYAGKSTDIAYKEFKVIARTANVWMYPSL